MARIRMLETHSFAPLGFPTMRVVYRAGHSYTVKADWATELEFLGKAVRVEAPPRPTKPAAAPKRVRARRARKA